MENITEIFADFIEKIKSGDILTRKGEFYRYGSIYSFKTSLFNLKEFEKSQERKLKIENIDEEFTSKFIRFLYAKNLTKNSVGNIINRFYEFTNHRTVKHLNINFYKLTLNEKTTSVYNTIEELEKINNLKLENKDLDIVRNLYVLQANLGLRYSDMIRLIDSNIKKSIEEHEKGFIINMKTRKTNELVSIPLRKMAIDIIYKRDLEYRGIQTINKHIKTICKEAGINREIVRTRTEGGVLTDKVFPKWKLISTHTARRSFATNAYLSGIPADRIMKVTGHVSESSFWKYIGSTTLQNAIELFEYDFFK